MKEIQLSQGKTAQVDDEDFEELNQYKWSAAKDGDNCYAIRGIVVGGKWTTQRMHCFIAGTKGVDHEDGNGLNNQRYNLRDSTQLQNSRNRSKSLAFAGISPTSQYKGVTWNKKNKKWISQITVDSITKHLGTFSEDQEVAAAKAYDAAAMLYFGKFARLNFIVDKTSAVV